MPVNYYSNRYIRVPHKNKVRTNVLPDRKQHGKNTPKHNGAERYCVLCKKAVMTERNYKSHISNNFFGKRYNHKYVKDE